MKPARADAEELGPRPLLLGMAAIMARKTPEQVLRKLDVGLPCDLAAAPLGLYPREVENYVHVKTCTLTCHSSFLCKSPKLETTQVSLSRQVDK